MKKDDVKKLPLGLYEIRWKSGSVSLAAIGVNANGEHWIAPINWIRISEKYQIPWKWIKSVKLLRVPK